MKIKLTLLNPNTNLEDELIIDYDSDIEMFKSTNPVGSSYKLFEGSDPFISTKIEEMK